MINMPKFKEIFSLINISCFVLAFAIVLCCMSLTAWTILEYYAPVCPPVESMTAVK